MTIAEMFQRLFVGLLGVGLVSLASSALGETAAGARGRSN